MTTTTRAHSSQPGNRRWRIATAPVSYTHLDVYKRQGLINVRGKVVPLADLRLRFGMTPKPPTQDTRIVVLELEFEGEPIIAGIRADKVHEVVEVAASSLQDTPKVGMKWRPEFIRCIGQRGDDFMVVLDIARVFAGAAHDGAVMAEQPPAVPVPVS